MLMKIGALRPNRGVRSKWTSISISRIQCWLCSWCWSRTSSIQWTRWTSRINGHWKMGYGYINCIPSRKFSPLNISLFIFTKYFFFENPVWIRFILFVFEWTKNTKPNYGVIFVIVKMNLLQQFSMKIYLLNLSDEILFFYINNKKTKNRILCVTR